MKGVEQMENQDNQNQQDNNETGLNKTLYTGMNGQKVSVWKFIVGIILLVGGVFLALSQVL